MPACKHTHLSFEPSLHAKEVGYKILTKRQLSAAAKAGPKSKDPVPSTFPAPLVLPGDELSYDPDSTADDVQTWIDGWWRNAVTPERRTIYLATTPSVSKEAVYAKDWEVPKLRKKGNVASPKAEDLLDYLKAFYHPLPVKLLTEPNLEFVPWDDPERIGLSIGDEAIGVRARKSPDGIYGGQLNLKDFLDTAMAVLPEDAYALLMMVDHDLYEDEEDDFCCGRAYGGSRVAVVSMARYNPLLDDRQGLERTHAWPASHCRVYMEESCRGEDEELNAKKTKKATTKADGSNSALHAAVQAHSALPNPKSEQALSNLWLGRACKTASHELGHCFGMDHCTYYACIMQGTAGLLEDARQPPYLCPVDLVKVLHATGADEAESYRTMLAFCEKFSSDRMFSAFGAWLEMRLKELD